MLLLLPLLEDAPDAEALVEGDDGTRSDAEAVAVAALERRGDKGGEKRPIGLFMGRVVLECVSLCLKCAGCPAQTCGDGGEERGDECEKART